MNNSVEEIEVRRLQVLERQAAMHGPNTEPAILIEIAELRSKKRFSTSDERKAFVTGLDFQFVMDVVAAALVRLGQVENTLLDDKKARWLRQTIHDGWMIAITIMVFASLLIAIFGR